ncbi:MAG: energy transducer TonB [Rhodospirillaceae bacterium]|nr:energy transducer TonB [Rhodospirillaceae bacterium]
MNRRSPAQRALAALAAAFVIGHSGVRADNGGGPGLELPPVIKKVAPKYPAGMARRGVEGWVHLGFTLTETGDVTDPFVIASDPVKVFEGAALDALIQWKFEPKLVNGQPVAIPNADLVIMFDLR